MTYLFDFDGTLVDSMGVFGQTMLSILDEYGIPYGDDMVKTVTPLGYGGTAAYFISLGIKSEKEALIGKMIEKAKDAYVYHIAAKPQVAKTLRALKEKGDSLHVLTASPHEVLDPCLKRLGLYALFDNVWSSDDFGTTKADPAIYRMAAEKIGVPVEDITFLDDNLGAVKTGKKAGMRVIGVYDESSADAMDEIKREADGYILDFSRLLNAKMGEKA